MHNPSYPSSSNDPYLQFSNAIKQAYYRFCAGISHLWSRITCSNANVQTTPTTPSLNSITTRRIMVSSWGRSRGDLDQILPVYVNALEIEVRNYQSQMPTSASTNLGKSNLSLTFQAVVALALTLYNSSSSSSPDHPRFVTTLNMVQAAMMSAFVASLGGIFLRPIYPRIANAFEKAGPVVAAMGLCLMSTSNLSGYSALVSWLASAFCILTSILYIFH